MKIFLVFMLLYLTQVATLAQSFPPDESIQRNLEELASREDAPTEDDSFWQELENLKRHPLDLNRIAADQLTSFPFLSPIQISSFITYRTLLGQLLSYYELQAIPGWDLETIRKLKPFVYIEKDGLVSVALGQQIREGQENFLLRFTRLVEESKGYDKPSDSSVSHYLGSPDKIFFRYNFSYKKILHLGFLGEKDAGEPFFGKYQSYGFDFYSFHLLFGQWGIIKNLIIGDFTVNLGQGLIQWQSLAFGKGGNVLEIKRQSPALRPYSSSGEFNFHRGIGITVSKQRWEATSFVSIRKLDANLVPDTLGSQDMISSFEMTGLHRTMNELADKGNIQQLAAGLNVDYNLPGIHFGLNGIGYQYSSEIRHTDLPYNIYGIKGRYWGNASLDYALTISSIHAFGEFAFDIQGHNALVMALLVSLGKDAGLSILYRNISAAYQAINGNAFTENTKPGNEQGFFIGLNLHPRRDWQFDFYFDIYRFPWLRFHADGPGFGKELFVQTKYNPSKSWTIYLRYRYEAKLANGKLAARGNYAQVFQPKHNLRTELGLSLTRTIELRSRNELLWFSNSAEERGKGFLTLLAIYFHPVRSPFSGNFCVQYFETSSYESRIYVYENDVLYGLNLPAYYDKGYHYYLNIRTRLNQLFVALKRRKPVIDFWLRWGQGIYEKKDNWATGLDEISGPIRSEWKFQIFFNW